MPGSELTPPVPLSTAKEKLSPSRARGRLWSESDSQLSLGVDAPAPRGIEATHQSSRTAPPRRDKGAITRSEEHTSELQSLMRISYAVFCLKKKKRKTKQHTTQPTVNVYKHKSIQSTTTHTKT